MTSDEIFEHLRERDVNKIIELYRKADKIREKYVGNKVFLRGIIEFSNYCNNTCSYCGLNSNRPGLKRYRMSIDEIISAARICAEHNIGTVVLQSGQDHGFSVDWMVEVIRKIKKEFGLVVTLSLGQRDYHELKEWKAAGADRYFLRFETSDDELYRKLHPGKNASFTDRIKVLEMAKSLGYEIGSGIMIGIPGQKLESLLDDIALFNELDVDMIGVGPYIPHPETELGKQKIQLQNVDELVYKVIAITRITKPYTNIPATTALATVNFLDGYKKGLMCGANVIMPNITPIHYKSLYEIYPTRLSKLSEEELIQKIKSFIIECDREVGKGRGDSLNFLRRREAF